MGFGRGKGFTAIKERVTLGAIVSKVVGAVSTSLTTEDKLTATKTMQLLALIGALAIDRPSSLGPGYTLIEESNPALQVVTITKVVIYAASNMSGVEVASFYKTNGDTFSTRDTEAVGDVAAGYSEHTVSLQFQTGDYIGVYCTGGAIEYDPGSGTGIWAILEDAIPCTNKDITHYATKAISLRGEGVI